MTSVLRSITFFFSLAIFFSNCTQKQNKEIKQTMLNEGIWRGIINVQGQELPFNFKIKKDVSGKYRAIVTNGEEILETGEVKVTGDSAHFPMHIFDADIKAKIDDNQLIGYWKKNYEEDYTLAFEAEYNNPSRFIPSTNGASIHENFSGKWDVTFVHDETDTTQAIGVFQQDGNQITGTFLTPTGDYRYLEGIVEKNEMKLSTFDGGHAFLFIAKKEGSNTLKGDFWSGKNWHESWTAIKNDSASLPDANTLTYLKEGYDKIDFSFPGLDGIEISPSDSVYTGKVLVLQIFGTWCPNCMDETKFLAPWYEENHQRGVEILGLAYEAKDDFEYAKGRVEKMRKRLDVKYRFVIAGHHDKKAAAETLPMLNHILSFPTTIFIDKKGQVRKIHTGFSGPGTGHYYEQFIKEFNTTIDGLLAEEG